MILAGMINKWLIHVMRPNASSSHTAMYDEALFLSDQVEFASNQQLFFTCVVINKHSRSCDFNMEFERSGGMRWCDRVDM